MSDTILVPPIKSQGIKTKLIPHIKKIISDDFKGVWIEPFLGTGVVALNLAKKDIILSDTNPHIINFYKTLQNREINNILVRNFLVNEGKKLSLKGSDFYYEVRDRCNKDHSVLDFLFLNRSCFNGMMRFNTKGGFNVPYCKKDKRFSKAYITKIVNQVTHFENFLTYNSVKFYNRGFREIILLASSQDLIYCDPPYIDRHSDYFNTWCEQDEFLLETMLRKSTSKFILSTWEGNQHRKNKYIQTIWSNYTKITQEHFYHIRAKEKNRVPMKEVLITNV